MEKKFNAKGHDITNRGRKVNSVMVNRPDIVQEALAQLNREAKEELVLLNIPMKDRVTENGIGVGTNVRFNLDAVQMDRLYPDHSVNETYTARTVMYPFQTSSRQYEVLLVNSKNEAMGYVLADCLNVFAE